MIYIIIILSLLIFCISPAFPQGASFSGTRGNSLNGRISPGGSFSATDEDGNFVNGHVSPGGHLQATDSNGNFINGNISPSGFFSGTDSNGNFLNGKVRNQDDDMLNTNPLGNDASRNSIYPNDAIDFSPEDELGKAVRAVQILDTLDSMDRRDQQAAFQQSGLDLREREMQQQKDALDRQMEMRLKEFDLNRTQEARMASKQASDLDQGIKKNVAALSLGEFTSVYDPTDVDHRSKLGYMRNWAIGEGLTAQEVNQGLADADNKTTALNSQLARMRNESGIQDWEITSDGKKIDVKATELKSQLQRVDLETIAKTWNTPERRLERILSVNKPDMGAAERIIEVNNSRQALTDYQNLMANNLWNPSEDIEKNFRKPVSLIGSDLKDPQNSATQYDLDALQTNTGYLLAKKYQNRIAAGETPVFITEKKSELDAGGNPIPNTEQEVILYDKNGVALIKNWVPSQDNSKSREAYSKSREASARATIAEQEAVNDPAFIKRESIKGSGSYMIVPARPTDGDNIFGQ